MAMTTTTTIATTDQSVCHISIHLQPSDIAWLTLAAGVVIYNIFARDGEMMSEGADRYMLSHPWLTRTVAAAVALHVINGLPDEFDPIHWLFKAKRWLNRQADL